MNRFIIALLLGSTLNATAQELVQDPALIELTATNHAEVVIILNEQLATAKDQLIRLEEQIGIMGFPAEVVEVPGSEAAAEAIGTAIEEGLLPTEELDAMNGEADGAIVFEETVGGLTEPIGATFTDEVDGEEQEFPRNAEFYEPEAAMLTRIREYKRVRESAIVRRNALQEALMEALENVRAAENFATIQKQRAVIDVLQTEIGAADSEIRASANDVEMLEREIINQAQVERKARSERAPAMEEPVAEEADEASFDVLRDRRMTWGPR